MNSYFFDAAVSYHNPHVANIPELTIHAEGKLGLEDEKNIFVDGSFLKSKSE